MAEQLRNQSNKNEGKHSPDDHLSNLLPRSSNAAPLWVSLMESVKELVRPTVLPPLEVTSKPIEIKEGPGMYSGNRTKSMAISFALNGSILGGLLLLGLFHNEIIDNLEDQVVLIAPAFKKPPPPPPPPLQPSPKQAGGGGGQNDKPATKGKAPPMAAKQFVRPTNTPAKDAKLQVQPTLIGNVDLPDVNMSNFGDPFSKVIGPPGLGTGKGTGIGDGNGTGLGPGSGGNTGGGVYKIGGGVSRPEVLTKVEPEYSEEARKAKYQGEVLLTVVVDENGVPTNIKVSRALGLGLDEKAIEAVQKWRFKPGMKDGKPVKVQATIAVTFHIL